jgi:hypothetical protein
MVRGQGGCPKGYIRRKGYTRKFRNNVKRLGYTVRRKGKVFTVMPKKNATYVASACIRNRGLPGKGPIEGEGIGELRKGALLKFGYSYRLPNTQRHAALKRAVEAYGGVSVYRKLDAVAKLSVRTAPDASEIFKHDRDWVRIHYIKK